MKKIILTILTISSMQLIAQEEKSTIKIYSPDESVKTDKSTNEDPNSYKWTVKTDLCSIIIGEFPIIYEHRLTEKISVEGSLGMTYPIVGNSFLDFKDDEVSSKTDSKPSTGYAFRGGFKYYPSSDWDAVEGWSFGFQAFTVTKNSTYSEEILSSGNQLGGFMESYVKKGLAVTIAKQVFWDSNISYEYMVGIGFATISQDYLINEYTTTAGMDEYKPKHDEDKAPSIKLGLRIGFGN